MVLLFLYIAAANTTQETQLLLWRRILADHYTTSKKVTQGRMNSCFHVFYARFGPCHLDVTAEIKTHETKQPFLMSCCAVFVSPCDMWLHQRDRKPSGAAFCCSRPSGLCSEKIFCVPKLGVTSRSTVDLQSSVLNTSHLEEISSNLPKAFTWTTNYLIFGQRSKSSRLYVFLISAVPWR